jgi:hypothetical protein
VKMSSDTNNHRWQKPRRVQRYKRRHLQLYHRQSSTPSSLTLTPRTIHHVECFQHSIYLLEKHVLLVIHIQNPSKLHIARFLLLAQIHHSQTPYFLHFSKPTQKKTPKTRRFKQEEGTEKRIPASKKKKKSNGERSRYIKRNEEEKISGVKWAC